MDPIHWENRCEISLWTRTWKYVGWFLSRNIKELPEWSFYKHNPIEFNKLCYTENDTGTFQRVDEVLQGIIEIKKKETKFQEMYQIIFQHIFIRIILLKTYCVISKSENISL